MDSSAEPPGGHPSPAADHGSTPAGARRSARADSPVVVTDGFWPKTLVAVRSLAAAGETVWCGEQTRFAPALQSRSCARGFRYPDPQRHGDRFAERLLDVAGDAARPVLLPMEEETLLAVLRRRERLESRFRIPFSSLELLEKLRDKGWLARHAARFGLPIPDTRTVTDLEDGLQQGRDLGFPLMVKLPLGSGGRGVTRVADESELRRALTRAFEVQDRPLLQRCLDPGGEAIGVSLLMDPDRGAVLDDMGRPASLVASVVHRRLRQYPPAGGSSTLREVVHDPALVSRCARFLATVDFRGVAMLEFKRDVTTGELLLLEINPRFWGSLHQAVLAGVPFPELLVRMARGERPDRIPSPVTAQRSRAFFPGDLLHFVRARPRPAWRSFFRFSDPTVKDEAFRSGDPWANLCKVVSPLALLWTPGLRHLATKPPRSLGPRPVPSWNARCRTS